MEELCFFIAKGEAEVISWLEMLQITPPSTQIVCTIILAYDQNEYVRIFFEVGLGDKAGVKLSISAIQ